MLIVCQWELRYGEKEISTYKHTKDWVATVRPQNFGRPNWFWFLGRRRRIRNDVWHFSFCAFSLSRWGAIASISTRSSHNPFITLKGRRKDSSLTQKKVQMTSGEEKKGDPRSTIFLLSEHNFLIRKWLKGRIRSRTFMPDRFFPTLIFLNLGSKKGPTKREREIQISQTLYYKVTHFR